MAMRKSEKNLRQEALKYHRTLPYGKLTIMPTKPLSSQLDLSLAYSPGVSYACEAIVDDPLEAHTLTARGNLVAVISNGTAVLGLGNIGPLASKPVMEGKAVLFKKFSNIDVFDIEVDEKDIDAFCDIVASLEPTFGGINLEDIAAPECFEIERKLKERMNIPVFHDDQHGTAIIAGAAVRNALEISQKNIEDVKIVTSGAGAAAISCLNFIMKMGAKKENIIVCDKEGVIHKGRNKNMDPYKAAFARDNGDVKTLAEAIVGADVFLGLSAGNVVNAKMVKSMAKKPLILALANPDPEVKPETVHEVRDDAIVCTGRSDYPNQVNNVLCFPFLFRGALDVGAKTINEEMKMAAAIAIANLAKREVADSISYAYRGDQLVFGKHYVIPKPLDPRLVVEVSCAVAKAAMQSGVATRDITDFNSYRHNLEQLMYRSSHAMRPIFEAASKESKRVVFCEGEDKRILGALPIILEENFAKPILIGRRRIVEAQIKKLNLAVEIDHDFELCDPENDPRFKKYYGLYHRIMSRKGISLEFARTIVRTRNTVIGALMVLQEEADAMICGSVGPYQRHLAHIKDLIGYHDTVSSVYGMSIIFSDNQPYFLLDTHINHDPTAEQIIEMTELAIEKVKLFGINPKIALLSHSNFGSSKYPSALKMKEASRILKEKFPDLEIEGEMHADSAFNLDVRESLISDNKLMTDPNIFVFPNIDSSNIAYNLLKVKTSGGVSVGPILLGSAHGAHVVTTSVTTRGIVNMAAYASLEASLRT